MRVGSIRCLECDGLTSITREDGTEVNCKECAHGEQEIDATTLEGIEDVEELCQVVQFVLWSRERPLTPTEWYDQPGWYYLACRALGEAINEIDEKRRHAPE